MSEGDCDLRLAEPVAQRHELVWDHALICLGEFAGALLAEQ